MSTFSYYQPRTQRKQHAPRTQDAHKSSLTVSFDDEEVAEDLLSYVIKCGGKVSTKQLQPWYKEHPIALKDYIKQKRGITMFAKESHCLAVTNPRAKDVFIQTLEYDEAHEAKVQGNPFDENLEELRLKITTQQSQITTQQSQITVLQKNVRKLTQMVHSLQSAIETLAINAASEDEASEEDTSEDSALADQVLAAYDAAPTAAASNDGPEIEEIE